MKDYTPNNDLAELFGELEVPTDEEETVVENEETTQVEDDDIEVEVQHTEEAVAEEAVEDTPAPSVPEFCVSLENAGDTLEFTEFNAQTYKYVNLKDPDGNPTTLYFSFCKDTGITRDNETFWYPMNGLLSKNHYSVARLEPYTRYLAENFPLQGTPRLVHSPYSLAWSASTQTNVRVFDDETSKLMFHIISGLGEEEVPAEVSTKVDIMMVNNYDGRRKLNLNYNLSTNFKDANSNNYSFTDLFTLNNLSRAIAHMGSISASMEELSNIQAQCDQTIARMKNFTDANALTDFITNVCKEVRKEEKQMLQGTWENLSAEHKNAFVAVLLCSKGASTGAFNFGRYYGIRRQVEKLLGSRVFASA